MSDQSPHPISIAFITTSKFTRPSRSTARRRLCCRLRSTSYGALSQFLRPSTRSRPGTCRYKSWTSFYRFNPQLRSARWLGSNFHLTPNAPRISKSVWSPSLFFAFPARSNRCKKFCCFWYRSKPGGRPLFLVCPRCRSSPRRFRAPEPTRFWKPRLFLAGTSFSTPVTRSRSTASRCRLCVGKFWSSPGGRPCSRRLAWKCRRRIFACFTLGG